MDGFLGQVAKINDSVNDVVWGEMGLIFLIGTGILLTILTKVFQITHIGLWWRKTIGSVFSKSAHNKKDAGSVSQFQALCTALAATIGTGNIAGVASAVVVGGPGAVFWMWIAAFFGMMTNFSENILGIYYRRKNDKGEWSGGAMYYLQDGLGSKKGCKTIGKILAIVFSCFAVLASFGIGNMGQINKIVTNIDSAFFGNMKNPPMLVGNIGLIPFIIGITLMIIAAIIILGGLKRIAAVAERIVPFMTVFYIIGSIIIICVHISSIGTIFAAIFKFAFGTKAVAGGAVGITVKQALVQGCKRGVFSNEAGLGSSVMVHSNSDVKEPIKQGLWGIFEVFADTMIVCTMTAVVVLSSGAIDLSTGNPIGEVDDATLVAKSFGNVFGQAGEWFVAIAILFFAFTTVLGWSHYGTKAIEYLFGVKATKAYKVIFILLINAGALMTSSLAWELSDTFNGLMMIPNLIGVLILSPLVVKLTKNYLDRRVKGKDIEPILSYDKDIQEEHAKLVKEGRE